MKGKGVPRLEALASEEKEEVISLEVDTSQVEGVAFPTSPGRIKELVRMRQTYWYDLLIHPHPPIMDRVRVNACGIRRASGLAPRRARSAGCSTSPRRGTRSGCSR